MDFLHLQQVGATLQLWCTGFSLQWLLLLWRWAHGSVAKAMWWWLLKLPLPSTNSNLTRDLNSELLVPHEHILPCQAKIIATIHVIMWQVLHQAPQFYLNRSFHCQLLNHFMKSASLSQFLLLQMQKRRLKDWIICPITQLIDKRDIFIQDCVSGRRAVLMQRAYKPYFFWCDLFLVAFEW